MHMSESLFSRKNVSRGGLIGATGFGLYSVAETVLGNNEGLWSEGLAFFALMIGLFANQPKATAHTATKKD